MSSRLRAAEGWAGPLAGALVPADPPRSPEGELQVYVDCAPLGAEQLAALERAGMTVDGVDFGRGRVRGSIDASRSTGSPRSRGCTRCVRSTGPSCAPAAPRPRATARRAPTCVRAQGLDGSGVVVGVISDGIDHLRGRAAERRPARRDGSRRRLPPRQRRRGHGAARDRARRRAGRAAALRRPGATASRWSRRSNASPPRAPT